jgi:hypothetical protein
MFIVSSGSLELKGHDYVQLSGGAGRLERPSSGPLGRHGLSRTDTEELE